MTHRLATQNVDLALFHYDAQRTVLLLHMLGGSRSTACLSQILDLDQRVQVDILHVLADSGFLVKDQNVARWQCSKLPEEIRPFVPQEDDQAGQMLLALQDPQNLTGCSLLQQRMSALVKHSRVNGASACLDLLIRRLCLWQMTDRDHAALRHYVDVILSCQSDAFALGACMKEAQVLSSHAKKAAHYLGDDRTMAQIHLVEGCLKILAGGTSDPVLLLRNGVQAIRALGDADIEGQINYFLAFLHYIQGDFAETYASFDLATQRQQLVKCRYFNEMFPLFLAPSALYLGMWPEALGMVFSALHTAQRRGNRHSVIWWHTLLSILLIQIDMPEAALEHLSQAINCTDAESGPKLHLWVWRGLALYHAQCGTIAASYTIMADCLKQREKHHRTSFAYTSPWFLELLHIYAKAGYPPLPAFELQQELDKILHSPNRHLHAMVYRILGCQRQQEGDLAKALDFFRKSHEIFADIGNKREGALSLQQLARCLAQNHEQRASAEKNDLANTILSTFEKQPWSDFATSNAIQGDWLGYVLGSDPEHCLVACSKALHNLHYTSSHESLHKAALQIVQRTLGAESAAFLQWNKRSSLECTLTCNMSSDELDAISMHPFHAKIKTTLTSKTPQLLVTEQYVVLCLPLNDPQHHALVLRSHVLADAFVKLTPQQQQTLMQSINDELRLFHRLESLQHVDTITPHILPTTSITASSNPRYDNGRGLHIAVEQARHAAQSDVPILILGETGVGKEVLANRIHEYSKRTGAFVPVHPASTPENLFESEFFGYEKGAFTGADRQKMGLFELAHNGTFFIDEVGEIPLSFQVKLLRVLQSHSFMRVGGTRMITSHFRLVTATNRDLREEVRKGRFREDLYYRISVIPITIPPLRERPEDIPDLLQLFIDEFATRYGRSFPSLSSHLIKSLQNYSWPGNVREMKNIIERAVILSQNGELDFCLGGEGGLHNTPPLVQDIEALYEDLPTLQELTIRYMRHVLQHTNGRVIGKGGAEHILGLSRSTLYAKLKQYNIKKP